MFEQFWQENSAEPVDKPQPKTGYLEESLLEQVGAEFEEAEEVEAVEEDEFDILPVQGTDCLKFNLDSCEEAVQQEEYPIEFDGEFSEEEILKYTSLEQPGTREFEWVMKELKDSERKKNGNIPKFLCRTLVNRYSKHKASLKEEPELMKELNELVKAEKKKYESNKNANNTLEDLRRMFCVCPGAPNPRKRSFWMRKMLHEILRTDLEEEVIHNHQIELTKEYLISLKVQALRCRNKELMCRLKAR